MADKAPRRHGGWRAEQELLAAARTKRDAFGHASKHCANVIAFAHGRDERHPPCLTREAVSSTANGIYHNDLAPFHNSIAFKLFDPARRKKICWIVTRNVEVAAPLVKFSGRF
jgi:hypothetical protein